MAASGRPLAVMKGVEQPGSNPGKKVFFGGRKPEFRLRKTVPCARRRGLQCSCCVCESRKIWLSGYKDREGGAPRCLRNEDLVGDQDESSSSPSLSETLLFFFFLIPHQSSFWGFFWRGGGESGDFHEIPSC